MPQQEQKSKVRASCGDGGFEISPGSTVVVLAFFRSLFVIHLDRRIDGSWIAFAIVNVARAVTTNWHRKNSDWRLVAAVVYWEWRPVLAIGFGSGRLRP